MTEVAALDLQAKEIIVVSNREPCAHELTSSGDIVARRPASGVISALEPVVQQCGGLWIALATGTADRLTADPRGHVTIEDSDGAYALRRLWLTPAQLRGYYYGFANEGLWPLCHRAFAAPLFRRRDWESYCAVNTQFARAIADEVRTLRPIVLVQDYHFSLVPQLLRAHCPQAIIATFWHIPWPSAEQFSLCPYAEEIVRGLLASDLVGFQTIEHAERFLNTVEDLGIRVPERGSALVQQDRHHTHIRAYPISVEWPNRWANDVPSINDCRRLVRSEYGIDHDASLVLSVDRLDYTKGFDERLAAMERLFELSVATDRRIAFLQIAAPSRSAIERYSELAIRVRNHIARLNARFGSSSTPISYVEQYKEPADVFRCYRAADVCYVGSLDDGMNLVAKEFVAARDDERGALVLSQFAGSACELTDALIVNPYDVDGVAETLVNAAALPVLEQQVRMREMRQQIATHDVHKWASDLLADALHFGQLNGSLECTEAAAVGATSNASGDHAQPAATDVTALKAAS